MSSSGKLHHGSQWWIASQLNELVKFEVEVEWSIMWLLISLGHVVAKVLDQFAGFLEVLQLLFVLLAQVCRAVWIVGCTDLVQF